MKKKNLIIAVLVLILSLTGVFYLLTSNGGPQKTAQAPPPAGPHAGHGGTPPPAAPAPSAPPGEEVIPMEEEVPMVEIPVDKQQLIGVKIVNAAVMPLVKTTRTVGRVAYDETRLATVNTKFEGWIERLYVDYAGMYVRKGQPLAEFYSPELYATQQEYLNILKWQKPAETKGDDIGDMLAKDAQSLAGAARERLRLFDINEAQIKKIEATGRPIRTLTIYSPVNGYVVDKQALRGTRVMPGDKLFDLADLSTVWVLADIYESELPLVKQGEFATISLSYFPGKEFRARVDYVYPTINQETRTAKIRFTIPNPGGRLKPQMFSDVLIKTPLGRKLVVPEDAVINTGVRQLVYVDKGEGMFEPREVVTGITSEGMTEVLSGLKEGEKVAGSASFLIDSESRLKGVVQ
jgi:Cu(I)/Ag(I) efflux system membrane fusion protein